MHNRDNSLQNQLSNFLKKRSSDPIGWRSFNKKNVEKAHEMGRPIFLAIGFSSCHWCELMGHESYSDPEIAKLINDNFLPLIVDKEDRPDVDSYFQQASHHLSGRSGWPLNAFLTCEGRPFFCTNYLPKNSSQGPTFETVVREVIKNLEEAPQAASETAHEVSQKLQNSFEKGAPVEFQGHFPHPMAVLSAIAKFKNEEDGGYAETPRFPNIPFYEWAIEQTIEGMIEQDEAKFLVDSLEKMLMGGVIDHVRGGIHRYTIDSAWQRPHFEKQLSGQASLIRLLAKLGLVYPSPLVFDTLINTLDYLATEMQSEDNFFFGSQHADSDGGEGLYYSYTLEEFEDAINKDDELSSHLEQIKKWLGITKEGNLWGGLNIISLSRQERQDYLTPESWEILRKAKKALWDERKKRIPPATDNKAIASWNFSMMSSLCDVIQYSKIEIIRNMASSILLKTLPSMISVFARSKSKGSLSLKHSNSGENNLLFFEDYVTFAEAQLRIYEVTGNPTFKENLKETMDIIKRDFIKEDKLYTRSINEDESDCVNQPLSPFDGSFRSPVTLYLTLLRRASRLLNDKSMQDIFETLKTVYCDMVLRNPVNSGEGLRAMTYPEQAYRILEVPKKWLHEDKFTSLLPFFMPRFILKYNDFDKWEIRNDNDCELQGESLEEFVEKITPKEAPPQS